MLTWDAWDFDTAGRAVLTHSHTFWGSWGMGAWTTGGAERLGRCTSHHQRKKAASMAAAVRHVRSGASCSASVMAAATGISRSITRPAARSATCQGSSISEGIFPACACAVVVVRS